jgi:23S rRNA (guanosine2251-2'-O)-methyltransferase
MAEINYVCGRNAVLELIKSGNSINKVLLLKSQNERRNSDIIHLLNKRAIPYQLVEKTVLDKYSAGAKHQGVLAFTAGKDYVEVEDILEIARQKGEEPLILMLDGIEDPIT